MDDSDIECFVDDDFLPDFVDPVPSKSSETNRKGRSDKTKYAILSVDDIVAEIMGNVFQVQELILVSEPTARLLLGHFNWDPNLLIQEYYEHENCNDFFASISVSNPFACSKQCDPSDSSECSICYADEATHGLECDHLFCRSCWHRHLTAKISDEGLSQQLECMEPKCDVAVSDEMIMDIITDDKVLAKFRYSMAKSFIQGNDQIRWCSSPDCEYLIRKALTLPLLSYACQCGEVYCFECGDPAHEIITCKQLEAFKNHTEGASYKWIIKNAKGCPKCSASIQKNGGCMHMTCGACRYEFCWTCMGAWNGHTVCNRYEGEANTAETFLARFIHYHDRYVHQIEALKLERILREKITKLAEDLKETMITNQILFLHHAVDTLEESRRTLAYTYAFAYYLRRNNQVEIFEDNQADLEATVERLSRTLERDVNESNISEVRCKVIDIHKYCSTRCDVLMGHIAEGKEKEWFTFNEK